MRPLRSDFHLRLTLLVFATFISAILTGNRSTLAQGSGTLDLPEGLTIHVVQAEEGLPQIAADYGVPVAKLMRANDILPGDTVNVGDRLLVPGSAGAERGLYDEEYVFTSLDNLFILAWQTHSDVDMMGKELRAVNPFGFYAGQTVIAPPISRTFGSGQQDAVLRLDEKESLVEIAVKYGLPVSALATANDLPDPILAASGSLVRVPQGDSAPSLAYSPWAAITITPQPVQTGRTFSIVVDTTEAGSLSGYFLEQDIPFITDEGSHWTVVGISRWQDPGIYPLTLTFTGNSGQISELSINLRVSYGGFISESLRIPDDIAAVLNDPLAVQAEIEYVASVMSGFTPDTRWNDSFLLPASGVLTSAYGTLRSYNGSGFNTFHSGADLAARTGTPIYAPADGVVINVAELNVRGLVTMIDHGFGVYSGYWHQSNILVEPGDVVVRGQQIGSIGSTGLSTASHLHWELWIRGTQVDAMQWVRESFP